MHHFTINLSVRLTSLTICLRADITLFIFILTTMPSTMPDKRQKTFTKCWISYTGHLPFFETFISLLLFNYHITFQKVYTNSHSPLHWIIVPVLLYPHQHWVFLKLFPPNLYFLIVFFIVDFQLLAKFNIFSKHFLVNSISSPINYLGK